MIPAEEKQQYKKEVKQALENYLAQFGYPNMQKEEIMSHLPDMYRTLEEKGLVKYGLNFQIFKAIAETKFIEALMGII